MATKRDFIINYGLQTDKDGVSTNTLVVDYVNDKVGIGVSNPTEKLDVDGNIHLSGELRAPATFIIDPAAIGDDTGTVEIKGNLTVQGTTTTINSTTVDLDHISLGDNEIANFGDSDDLQIYHDGSNSYIKDQGTGFLDLDTNGSDIRLSSGEEIMIKAIKDGAVEFYYDNNQKLQTTSLGIKIGSSTAPIDINAYESLNNGTLSFEGSAGQLFSITNKLTSGSIFSVNDVSGIPSIDVDANGTITLAEFGGNVGIGVTTVSAKLHVAPASAGIGGLFSGTTSTDMVRITQLGTGNALVVEDETNPDSTPFVVDASGNVGIGLTTPTAKLQVTGNVILGSSSTDTLTVNATSTFNAPLTFTGATSHLTLTGELRGPATFIIDPSVVGDNTGTVVIKGDLQVDGVTTTINSTTLTVDDKNIILASGAANDAAADGGGITLESGDGNKTLNWIDSTDSWTSSENIDLLTGKVYKINNVEVLSATTLGSSVINSSLTSVGNLDGLTVEGDVNINDGGTFSTTIQTQTPTANRVITYPDATGTLSLVAGSTGQVTYNLNGANAGDSNFTYSSSTGLSLGTPLVVSVNSSSDAIRITQLGAGDAIVVEDSTSPDSTPFVVNASGNVGIKKSSPTVELDVVGSANFTGTVADSTGTLISGIEVKKETVSVSTGITALDFTGEGVSAITESSGVATINITADISPVMMGMIF